MSQEKSKHNGHEPMCHCSACYVALREAGEAMAKAAEEYLSDDLGPTLPGRCVALFRSVARWREVTGK